MVHAVQLAPEDRLVVPPVAAWVVVMMWQFIVLHMAVTTVLRVRLVLESVPIHTLPLVVLMVSAVMIVVAQLSVLRVGMLRGMLMVMLLGMMQGIMQPWMPYVPV